MPETAIRRVPTRRAFVLVSLLALMALMLSVSVAVSGPTRGPSPEEAAIRAVLETQRQAWNRGDLTGFMAAYWDSDSLSFYSGGSITHGWTTTRDRYQRRYQSEGHEMGTLVFELHSVEVLAKDAAIVKGGWALTMKDGNPRGLFTLVLRKVKGAGWRIVHDHTSVEAAK